MFQEYFKQVFEAFEPTLEEWLQENNLVLCDHQLVIFESKTQKFTLMEGGEFNDLFPLSTQQYAVISSGGATLVDTVIDSVGETVRLNSRYNYLPIGENYFLTSERKRPFRYALYIRK